jgi:hypothetical protein
MTGKRTSKKKKVEFLVRSRGAKEELPASPEQWVQAGKGPEEAMPQTPQEEIPQKRQEKVPQTRLTLNLPEDLHTAFKGRCVAERITIQDKVRVLIERELAAPAGAGEGKPPL